MMPESMHMIMWVMSDRAIPRSFRFIGRLRGAYLSPGYGRGEIDVREVSLEAQAGSAVGSLERSGEDQWSRSRLSSQGSVECHSNRQFPGVGSGTAALR